MKKVNHWINGKNVAGNDYFQTTNPATGEVLADVASGGEAEYQSGGSGSERGVPEMGQSADERARAPDAPSGRSDRPERAGDRRDGNRGRGPADPSDQKRVDPTRFSQL